MKITKIKQQIKRANRYSVYIDGKYSYSLSENELLNQRLKVGQEFDNVEFEHAQQVAVEDKAYSRALDLLARRPRSVWEMDQFLKKKGYDNNVRSIILNKLINRELLNDKKFASAWVLDRRALKNISKRRLLQELQQKNISKEIIFQTLEADETDEQDVLRILVEKKRFQSRYQDKHKLIAYLLRQGFDYEDIKQVMVEV